MSQYNYQYGYCHYFAKYIIGELRRKFPHKEVNHFLLLVDEIDNITEEIVHEFLVHVYIKIGDLFFDSDGITTYDNVIKRMDEWVLNQKKLTPDTHRLQVWLEEDTDIPEHFFDGQFCDTSKVEQEVKMISTQLILPHSIF